MAQAELHTIKPVMASRMHEIARRVVWQQSHTEILRDLGISYRQLRYCIQRPEFLRLKEELETALFAEVDQRHKDEIELVRQKARNRAMSAMDKILSLMETAPSAAIQRDCANDVLDLAGVRSVNKASAPAMVFTNAQIVMLQKAVAEDEQRRIPAKLS